MFQHEEIVTAREQRLRGAELQSLTDGRNGLRFSKMKSGHRVAGDTWVGKCAPNPKACLFFFSHCSRIKS